MTLNSGRRWRLGQLQQPLLRPPAAASRTWHQQTEAVCAVAALEVKQATRLRQLRKSSIAVEHQRRR